MMEPNQVVGSQSCQRVRAPLVITEFHQVNVWGEFFDNRSDLATNQSVLGQIP